MDHDADTMMEHCFSSPTPSIIETSDEMSTEGAENQWFSKLTRSLKENIPAVIDGVAQTINDSARTLINELSELENQANRDRYGDENSQHIDLVFPWELFMETKDEHLNITIAQKKDDLLKEQVFALSHEDSTFTGPFTQSDSDDQCLSFCLDQSRIMLIRNLLELDENLGLVHARLSGRSEMEETLFWKNYFHHCDKLRLTREEELKKEHLRRTSYDNELDAELVGRPPASCTGFYPRTGDLQVSLQDGEERAESPNQRDIDSFVIIDHHLT